jgi:hypothetical protein
MVAAMPPTLDPVLRPDRLSDSAPDDWRTAEAYFRLLADKVRVLFLPI